MKSIHALIIQNQTVEAIEQLLQVAAVIALNNVADKLEEFFHDIITQNS